MKLKPSLFQLIVVLMTSSLIVSCNTYQQGSQVDCNDPTAKQSQKCNPSSRGGSVGVGVYRGAGANSVNSTGNSSSDSSSTSKSSSSSGRGGFGSSSSGKAGG